MLHDIYSFIMVFLYSLRSIVRQELLDQSERDRLSSVMSRDRALSAGMVPSLPLSPCVDVDGGQDVQKSKIPGSCFLSSNPVAAGKKGVLEKSAFLTQTGADKGRR